MTSGKALRETVCLVGRSKVDMHTRRERVWASPLTSANEEECSKEAFVIPIGQFFQVFVVLQADCLVSFSTPDPLGDTPLGRTLIPQPRWILKGRLLGGARLQPGIIPRLLPHKEAFCARVVSFLSQKSGGRRLLVLYKNSILPLFAMTITLRCLQETNIGYLPCFCCHFHFRGQTGD